jgi:hypothetical protein
MCLYSPSATGMFVKASPSLIHSLCMRVDLFCRERGFTNTHTTVSRLFVRAEQYEKDIKLKQNIFLFFIRAFFTFIQFMILGTCYVGIMYSVMAVLPVHIASCYRPELLFKDHYFSRRFANFLLRQLITTK